jgi:polyisoprenoid-binding protein YceI
MKGTIKVSSIDTDDKKRDDHLQSADFFDASNHPRITFASKKVGNTARSTPSLAI